MGSLVHPRSWIGHLSALTTMLGTISRVPPATVDSLSAELARIVARRHAVDAECARQSLELADLRDRRMRIRGRLSVLGRLLEAAARDRVEIVHQIGERQADLRCFVGEIRLDPTDSTVLSGDARQIVRTRQRVQIWARDEIAAGGMLNAYFPERSGWKTHGLKEGRP